MQKGLSMLHIFHHHLGENLSINIEVKIFFHVPELAIGATGTKAPSPCVVYLTPQINLWCFPELTIRWSAELHNVDITCGSKGKKHLPCLGFSQKCPWSPNSTSLELQSSLPAPTKQHAKEKGEDTCMGDWFPLLQTQKYFAGMFFRARTSLV